MPLLGANWLRYQCGFADNLVIADDDVNPAIDVGDVVRNRDYDETGPWIQTPFIQNPAGCSRSGLALAR